MYKHLLLTTMSLLWAALPSFSQCLPGENEIRLEINSDEYWWEVSWTIKDLSTGQTYVAGSLPDSASHTYTYCVPQGCAIFDILDDYGDGMAPDGYYRLFVNGELAWENIGGYYGDGEFIKFGCPPGATCESAFPVDTGTWATPNGSETWYRFVPADTGMYQINTCNPLNSCGSKIWVYGQCAGIIITDNLTGSIYYADGGCDNGALATMRLAGGQDYIIRLRYEPDQCDTTPIHFNLSYLGPISGCLDPLACNYDPLATISGDTCIYPGDPNCPQAPDLVTRQDVLINSLNFISMDNPDICAVEEGCIRGLGNRDLIRFTTYIENTGDADYYIGKTPSDISEPSTQFVWDPCHHHWHYLGYADYILFDSTGLRIPIGSKTGFCVLDLICPPEDSQYDCETMGITAGCADAYDFELPCQWIDITNLPAGKYTMVVRVNWDKSPDKLGRIERDFNNNWAQACFTLSYSGGNPDVEFDQSDCPQYTDCTGEVFGNAQPDCNGICNGPALMGDINQDTLRTTADLETYLAMANTDNGDPSNCFDLNDDGIINLYDEALLQECVLHSDDPQYWVQRFPCQFPGGFDNLQDLVTIQPASLDTVSKTFDLDITNPFNKIMGYEFTLSGLVIDSIENLDPDHHPNLRFNQQTGEIVGMGLDESAINKNALPDKFLRVHYSSLTDTSVCVKSITTVVNNKYHRSNAAVGIPGCMTVIISSSETPTPLFGVYVQPNPFTGNTTIFFENEAAEPMDVVLTDVTGRVLRSFTGIRDNAVTIERANLPAGTYFFSVSGQKGRVTGKVIAQ